MAKKMNKTPYAILGMLSISPMSGYDMRQIMRDSTSNFWAESDGQLYPTLASLSKQKLISYKQSKKTGRDKKIYTVTPQGMKMLKEWLVQEPETQIVRNEAMLKLFFGVNISTEINKEHVEAQRYQAKAMQLRMIETKKQLTQDYKDSPHLPYWLMTIDYALHIALAKIAWCKGVVKQLEILKQ